MNDVVTPYLASQDTATGCGGFLRTHSIRHVPLVRGGRLCGIVSDRDVKLATPSPLDPNPAYDRPVSTIMNADVITISPDDLLLNTARLMGHRKIRCLPVTSGDRLIENTNDTGVLDVFLAVCGVEQGKN